ncbi:MAG: ABC transporter ATP-binding protein [Actinomycetota bacterium]
MTDLHVQFETDLGIVRAVDGVSYAVGSGETLAVVGESGSGKTVSALSVMGLVPPPGRIVSGSVRLRGQDLVRMPEAELRKVRGRSIGMIFQDPLSALNPVMRVGRQISEAVRIHQAISRRRAKTRAVELLELVGIPNPAALAEQYPHEFSGGMRQRVLIAIAIANSPSVLIADEPTTALDVTIQAQILDLLKTLQKASGMALVLITHDFGIVAEQADRVLVMYAGRVVEYAEVDLIYKSPLHPYTMGLIASVPRLDRVATERLTPISGHPPSLIQVPCGCAFHPRCPCVRELCRETTPSLNDGTRASHFVSCHFAGNLPERSPPEEAGGFRERG